MRRTPILDLLIGLLLVSLGVALRMAFIDVPNFAPVAAIALFSGYAIRSRMLAVAVPIAIMAISDRIVGGYEPAVMGSVYAMLMAPVFVGRPLRNTARLESFAALNTWKSVGLLGGCALLSSCLFFVVTNLACWKFSGWYEQSWTGLVGCFAAALPFFRFTFAGDLGFTLGFFAVYAVCRSLVSLMRDARLANPIAA